MFTYVVLFAAIGVPVQGAIVDSAVDISHWQKTVDFVKLRKSGVNTVIHKATQGNTYVDPEYFKHKNEAKAAGLQYWGAYHFADNSPGKEQARHFLSVGRNADFLAVDLEPNGNKTVGLEQAEDIVLTLTRETGRRPMIYGGANFLNTFSRSAVLAKCPLWVASWRNGEPILPRMWKEWVLWQHTDGVSGSPPHEAPGVGKCDRDKVNETKFLQYLSNLS